MSSELTESPKEKDSGLLGLSKDFRFMLLVWDQHILGKFWVNGILLAGDNLDIFHTLFLEPLKHGAFVGWEFLWHFFKVHG